jgi:quercetin dioxygenase-like cupin family protein
MIPVLSVACLCWSVGASGLGQDPVEADPRYRVEFQDDQVRVLRVTLGPGDTGVRRSRPDAVVVFLTADLQGHIARPEAQWEPAGDEPEENLAKTSFAAIVVELLAPPSGQPPTLTILPFASGPLYGVSRPTVMPLIDNERVFVSRERFPGGARGDYLHALPTDTVIVYLRSGDVGGTSLRGPSHVRRGEVDVLPPNTLHQFVNLGFDPIEFIVIYTK